LRFGEKIREDYRMVHGRVVRRIDQSCVTAPDLAEKLCCRRIRFQLVAVTLLELGEAVRPMVEPNSE